MAEFGLLPDAQLAVVDACTLRLLDACRLAALPLDIPKVFVTAGSNGVHSGPADPHYVGHALDIRTHNMLSLDMKKQFLGALVAELGDQFFAFLEDAGTPNEHVHVQLRRFVTYAPTPIAPRAATT